MNIDKTTIKQAREIAGLFSKSDENPTVFDSDLLELNKVEGYGG